jgi:hypothetical protein
MFGGHPAMSLFRATTTETEKRMPLSGDLLTAGGTSKESEAIFGGHPAMSLFRATTTEGASLT